MEPARKSRRKLTLEQEQQVDVRYRAGGVSMAALAREFGVSPHLIARTVSPEARRKQYEAARLRDEENPEGRRERGRRHAERHRDAILERRRAKYHATDPAIRAARKRRWRDPERERTAAAAYYAEHREAILAYGKKWRAANNARVKWHEANRRLLERTALVEHVDRNVVWERDGGLCGICGLAADPADWHLDHITALARGGDHSYANVQVAHPRCNQCKWAH